MLKRLNFTERRRIPRDRIQIEIAGDRQLTISFDFSGMNFLAGAEVILEAMSSGSSVVERLLCGHVHQWDGSSETPSEPLHKQLIKVEGKHFFFVLKVVDRTEQFGRIIGFTRQIRQLKDDHLSERDRHGILPIVESHTIGDEFWKLDFQDTHVLLCVNAEIPGLIEDFRTNPQFHSLIYPGIIRCVLSQAIENRGDPEDEDDERWETQWLKFGRNLHPERENPPEDIESASMWIDAIIQEFCKKHRLKERYLTCNRRNTDHE